MPTYQARQIPGSQMVLLGDPDVGRRRGCCKADYGGPGWAPHGGWAPGWSEAGCDAVPRLPVRITSSATSASL